ncbi:four-carbon acid sugar kinase family protein [Halobacteriales archaeon QS_1_68_17]|nr:MAG: four-carbon acid sugar kinase family protein [Halobacteriales archaeon QS_1_68_17]
MTGSPWDGLVVADDLTGALDTGHAFAVRGRRVVVPLADDDPSPGGVVVVDTDSREAAADEAVARVRAAVERRNAATVYKKVDSTLRGNVVAETDAAMAAAGATLAVVAPAFPATGRATACGTHLVDGRPVTDWLDDGAAARPSSWRLDEVFADSTAAVERVGIDRVARGPAAVARALPDEADGPGLAVCDAIHDSHLEAAAGAVDGRGDVLFVGSGGLAPHVPLPDAARGPASWSAAGPRVLAVAGSTAAETRAQVDAVPDEAVVALPVAAAVRDPETAAERTAPAAIERLRADEPAVVTSVPDASAVEAATAAAREAGVSRATAGDRIAAALARTALLVRAESRVDGLVLTGGAVAAAVLSAGGAGAVELTGDAVAAGVPVGVVDGGTFDGIPVVTKAGGFGESTTVISALAHLSSDG